MNASATESADDAITVRIPRLIRRCCVILLYVLAAFWGVAQIVSSANGLIYILSALLFATAATYAAIEDSRLLRIQFVRILQVLFFFTWPIASLICLMVTRDWLSMKCLSLKLS